MYLGRNWYSNFEKEIWFELSKSMWSKHRINYQDHINYIHNEIVKPFRVGNLQYSKQVRDMHDLDK